MADQGLPMTPKWDPEKLQQDVQQLEELQSKPLIPKTLGYIKRCGPGLLQSAMTLGAGSAAASVAAGAAFVWTFNAIILIPFKSALQGK